jgi:predicted transcriptional regulator
MDHLSDELNIKINELNLHEIKTITTTILDIETQSLKDDVESLLEQKELIERSLQKKSDELQKFKYSVFRAMEVKLENQQDALSKLHQVKLQSIDLYDFLSEMVESAIITALEKDKNSDIIETYNKLL